MDMVTLHSFHDLDLAESELNSYCSSLPPDVETEKCWQASAGMVVGCICRQHVCIAGAVPV